MTNRSLHDMGLAVIHQLLASTTTKDLRAASDYIGASQNIRTALRALAAEAEITHLDSDTQPRPVVTSQSKGRPHPKPKRVGVQSASQLLLAMEHSSVMKTKGALEEVVERFGLNVTIRPKDSRREAIRKVLNATKSLPDQRRKDFLEHIFPESNSQTEGWIHVIMGAR